MIKCVFCLYCWQCYSQYCLSIEESSVNMLLILRYLFHYMNSEIGGFVELSQYAYVFWAICLLYMAIE